jgi:hypothetical protein
MSEILYVEGTVFSVPLGDSGYARGVIARASSEIFFGYFFGPRLLTKDDIKIDGLKPEFAILKTRFGGLGLAKGKWEVIGRIQEWNREQWFMPDFIRRDPLGRLKSRLIRYSDGDPSQMEMNIIAESEKGLLNDGLAGSGFVEERLANILEF